MQMESMNQPPMRNGGAEIENPKLKMPNRQFLSWSCNFHHSRCDTEYQQVFRFSLGWKLRATEMLEMLGC
jgi:hypothetical protein